MQNGRSLLECLLVLVVMTTATTLALPLIKEWKQRNDLLISTNLLRQDISYARYQAVLLQTNVSIRPISVNCWSCGWAVFPTDMPDQAFIERSGSPSVKISSNRPWRNGAEYRANGTAVQSGGAFAAGTITLCAPGLAQQTRIIISRSGRPRVSRDAKSCS